MGSMGTRWWRLASGLAEWMSASQDEHSEAASALHRNAAGARSHASHTHTRSCREATRFAAWILASHPAQRNAESARQNTVHGAARHVSHMRGAQLLHDVALMAPLRVVLVSSSNICGVSLVCTLVLVF